MQSEKFNTLALIGACITVITFGGGFISTYVKLENRLSVIEYQIANLNKQADVNNTLLRDLKQQK